MLSQSELNNQLQKLKNEFLTVPLNKDKIQFEINELNIKLQLPELYNDVNSYKEISSKLKSLETKINQ